MRTFRFIPENGNALSGTIFGIARADGMERPEGMMRVPVAW